MRAYGVIRFVPDQVHEFAFVNSTKVRNHYAYAQPHDDNHSPEQISDLNKGGSVYWCDSEDVAKELAITLSKSNPGVMYTIVKTVGGALAKVTAPQSFIYDEKKGTLPG